MCYKTYAAAVKKIIGNYHESRVIKIHFVCECGGDCVHVCWWVYVYRVCCHRCCSVRSSLIFSALTYLARFLCVSLFSLLFASLSVSRCRYSNVLFTCFVSTQVVLLFVFLLLLNQVSYFILIHNLQPKNVWAQFHNSSSIRYVHTISVG